MIHKAARTNTLYTRCRYQMCVFVYMAARCLSSSISLCLSHSYSLNFYITFACPLFLSLSLTHTRSFIHLFIHSLTHSLTMSIVCGNKNAVRVLFLILYIYISIYVYRRRRCCRCRVYSLLCISCFLTGIYTYTHVLYYIIYDILQTHTFSRRMNRGIGCVYSGCSLTDWAEWVLNLSCPTIRFWMVRWFLMDDSLVVFIIILLSVLRLLFPHLLIYSARLTLLFSFNHFCFFFIFTVFFSVGFLFFLFFSCGVLWVFVCL